MSKHTNALMVRAAVWEELGKSFKSFRGEWAKGHSGIKAVDSLPKEDVELGLLYAEKGLSGKAKINERAKNKVAKVAKPKKAASKKASSTTAPSE